MKTKLLSSVNLKSGSEVQVLIEAGSDVFLRNIDGRTARLGECLRQIEMSEACLEGKSGDLQTVAQGGGHALAIFIF